MRKDVRMGFAVGGVMLAVVIVAVLVIHRNHNQGKQVSFDPGKGSASTDSGTADLTDAKAMDVTSGAPANVATGGGDQPAARPATPPTELAQADPAKEAPSQWDELFASTKDPIQANLTSPAMPSPKPSHSRDPKPSASMEAKKADTSAHADTGSTAMFDSASDHHDAGPDHATAGVIPKTYKVQSGETFTSIAKKVYGQSKYYMAIERANPLVNAERLKPGTVIELPPADEARQSGKAAASHHSGSAASTDAPTGPALSTDGKTYTVQKDDNLYRIARKLYGNGEREDAIYELNKTEIGPDRARLKLGMVLKLPESPTAQASR